MKKNNIILYLFALVGLSIVACDPMEDINSQVQRNQDDSYKTDSFIYEREIAPAAYTLMDEDYELSSNEDLAKYKSFSAYVLPKDYLPEILNAKFTAEDAYEMFVTYDYYSSPVVDEEGAYVIDTVEYAEMGQSNPNFGDEDEAEGLIGKLLDRKIYVEDAGAEMTVQYNLFLTNETRYFKVNSDKTTEVLEYEPDDFYELDTIDYEDLGNGEYDSFYDLDEAQEKLVDLVELRDTALPVSYACVVYKNYYTPFVVYIYSETNWVAKESVMPTSEALNYALDGDDITKSTWWADPAIKITLSSEDYAVNPETAKYSNFDLRSGEVPGTDEDKLIEMLGTVLDTNYNLVDDQQYLVSYAYYDGANGIGSMRMLRKAGVWAEYEQ